MVTGKMIRRAAFLMVIVTGVGCTGGAVGPETKAGDKPGAGPQVLTIAGPQVLTLQAAESVTAAADQPHELAMRPLPAYRLEPPDVIAIDMPRLVPIPPYRAEIFDTLRIQVANALKNQPIDNYFMVEADGVVTLGPAYGSVRVAGMTLKEMKKAIEVKLGQVIREPEVSVQVAKVYAVPQVSGQYLIGPDGTINLRKYGTVQLSGLTIPEAKAALEKQLSKYLSAGTVRRRGGL